MKLVYLEVEEEITSVIDKLQHLTVSEVTLVVPKGANLIQSIINLKLLKKHAQMQGKEVVIVTGDQVGVNLAKRAGLSARRRVDHVDGDFSDEEDVDESINLTKERKKRAKNKKSKQRVRGYKEIEKDGLGIKKTTHRSFSEPSKKNKPAEVDLIPKRRVAIILVIILLILLAIAAFVYFYLPKATVLIDLKTERITNDVSIEVTDAIEVIDSDGNRIPGKLYEVELEGSKEAEATGEKEIGEKAQGTITIYNTYQTTPRTIVPSRFMAADGKIFKSTESVTLPGYEDTGGDNKIPGTVTVQVEAEEPGEGYNIGSSKFSLPALDFSLSKDIYAESSTGMVGGKSEKVRVVSDNDLKKVEENLLKELKEKAVAEYSEEGYEIIPEGSKVEVIEYNPSSAKDEEADEFTLKIKVKFSFLAFQPEHARNVASDDAEDLLPSDRFSVGDVAGNVDYSVKESKIDEGKMEIVFHEEKVFARTFEKDLVKEEVKSLDEEGVKAYFRAKEEVDGVQVEFWPFWVKMVPERIEQIEIDISTN